MLSELIWERCKGCYACIALGAEKCPLKDKRDIIVEEMLAADGIIFASSVNVNNITALMKEFMGRIGYETHRPRLYDKYAMVMAVCGGFGAKEANEYMSGIFATTGLNVVSSLELQVATKSEEEKKYNREKTNNAFNTLITRIKEGKRNKPTLTQIIMFNLLKSISELAKEHFQADYQYYKDKANFYYDIKLNPFKNMLVKRIVQKEIKKILNPSLR
jgi:multimeric flavodoxin WrbA